MKPIPRGRFNLVEGLPCLTCGLVALDWQKLARRKGSGYFPRKGEPVYLHVTMRRQDHASKTWAVWPGGTVLTTMPVGTDVETLRRAATYMMSHLYWPVRDFKDWAEPLGKLAAITPVHFPEVGPEQPS